MGEKGVTVLLAHARSLFPGNGSGQCQQRRRTNSRTISGDWLWPSYKAYQTAPISTISWLRSMNMNRKPIYLIQTWSKYVPEKRELSSSPYVVNWWIGGSAPSFCTVSSTITLITLYVDIFQAPLQNCWSAAAVISTKIMCRTKPDLRQIEDLRLRHERVEGVKEQYEGWRKIILPEKN